MVTEKEECSTDNSEAGCTEVIKRIEKDIVTSNENCYDKDAETCGPINCRYCNNQLLINNNQLLINNNQFLIINPLQDHEHHHELSREDEQCPGGHQRARVCRVSTRAVGDCRDGGGVRGCSHR